MLEILAASLSLAGGIALGWYLRGRSVTVSTIDAAHREQHTQDIAAITEVLGIFQKQLDAQRLAIGQTAAGRTDELGKVIDEVRSKFGMLPEAGKEETDRPKPPKTEL